MDRVNKKQNKPIPTIPRPSQGAMTAARTAAASSEPQSRSRATVMTPNAALAARSSAGGQGAGPSGAPAGAANKGGRGSNTLKGIERLREAREQRRSEMEASRLEKKALMDKDPGNPNWEFRYLIEQERKILQLSPIRTFERGYMRNEQIIVCVRKRPINERELANKETDVLSVPSADRLILHQPRAKVDTTKYIENYSFQFDFAFDEEVPNELIYKYTCVPLIHSAFQGGNATCFAYGQTGSGKTFIMTGGGRPGAVKMKGIFALAAYDIFGLLPSKEIAEHGLSVSCSYFEIYGVKVYDLMSSKKPELKMVEDSNQAVQLLGLTETPVHSVDDVLNLIAFGDNNRMMGQTAVNAISSRSHAVFQIKLIKADGTTVHGMCSFIDLAGNERGIDNAAADRSTRLESADINKSLLALKECIRGLVRQTPHLPFRDSKLTQILRDSFVGSKKNRTCMIAMLSPGHQSCEHTLNTLRYAEAVKGLGAKRDALEKRTSSVTKGKRN